MPDRQGDRLRCKRRKAILAQGMRLPIPSKPELKYLRENPYGIRG